MGLLAAWVDVFANIAQIFLLVLGMFLILVVLLQRGRGGGLAGAFGGAGGQSAFGTKAGDVFTKITIGIAILWVITNGVSGMLIRASQSAISESQLPGGDDEEDGETVTGTDDESDVPLADELDDTGTGDGAAGTPEDGEGEGTPDAGAVEGTDGNTPDSLDTPETEIDPEDTGEAATDTPDDGEATTPETGDAATEGADAEEATESTDVPSTDAVEENATPPDSSDEAAEVTTDGSDVPAVPPN